MPFALVPKWTVAHRPASDGALNAPFQALPLNPPMLFPGVCPPTRPGGQSPLRGKPARDAQRARGGFRTWPDVLRGTHGTFNALRGTLKTSSHVPKTPLAPLSGPSRAGRCAPCPRSGLCPPSLAGGQTPAKSIGGFRLSVLKGTLKASQLSRSRPSRARHPAGCGWARSARRPRSGARPGLHPPRDEKPRQDLGGSRVKCLERGIQGTGMSGKPVSLRGHGSRYGGVRRCGVESYFSHWPVRRGGDAGRVSAGRWCALVR